MSYAKTDLGNAEFFVARHGTSLRYVRERKQWLVWEGGRWRRDVTGHAERAAKDTVRDLFLLAADLDGDAQKDAARWALTSQSEAKLRALLKVAESEPGIAIAAEDLDRDPYLLTCANGTLDLRRGELRPASPIHLISLGNDVVFDPDATCPRWLKFLHDVFNGDTDLVAFFRRLAGYFLTGDTKEHKMFVAHGSGCNGKTTAEETIKKLLGGLAATSAFDTFVRSRGDRGPRNDIARLHRARLVVANESGQGHRLDEALIKTLTGGDTIAARYLYAEHFEFQPHFKLLLVTNHRPKVDGSDDAIWRRLRLIPFEVSFEGREDRDLPAKLEAELPGILAWAVEGCLEWQRSGLGSTPKVANATASYRAEEDVLGAFLTDNCVHEGEVLAADFRDAFAHYCRDIGEREMAANVLGKQLAAKGIEERQTREGRIYNGIRLLQEGEASPAVTGYPGNSPSRARASRELRASPVTPVTENGDRPTATLDEDASEAAEVLF
jgi:putative DNA primase/helicase